MCLLSNLSLFVLNARIVHILTVLGICAALNKYLVCFLLWQYFFLFLYFFFFTKKLLLLYDWLWSYFWTATTNWLFSILTMTELWCFVAWNYWILSWWADMFLALSHSMRGIRSKYAMRSFIPWIIGFT